MLATERLLLRDYEQSDWQSLYESISDPEAVRYRLSEIKTEEQVHAFIQRAVAEAQEKPRQRYQLAVLLKAENQLIGECELFVENFHHVEDFDNSQARIGYAFNPKYWGQGYATEAARAIVAFGFEQLKLHRIYAPCVPENIASARVLERIGMRREGHFRKSLWMKGCWVDVLLYAILDYEWHEFNRA